MAELVCPTHGPYDASYGTCPYCAGGAGRRPAEPRPLSDDELPTDLGMDGPVGGGGFPAGEGDGEGPTEIPGHRAQKNFLDYDEEEETQMGRVASGDVTEIEASINTMGPFGILWIKEGHRRGHIHKIKEGTTVGRKEGELILDDPKVSGTHAKFTFEGDTFVVWDFGSANGTYVNGKRIRQATPLNENDLIKIGDTVFIIKLLDPPRKKAASSKKAAPAKKKPAAKKK
jgi:hypothetical protein